MHNLYLRMVVAVLFYSLNGFLEFWDFFWFSCRQCVRDWSGILLERSGKRYSGKPDGFAGTPKRKFMVESVEFIIYS